MKDEFIGKEIKMKVREVLNLYKNWFLSIVKVCFLFVY